MFDEYLTERIFTVYELTVGGHKDSLTLRRVVGFSVFVVNGKFFAVAHDIVEPARFRRAACYPDISRFKFARKARDKRLIEHIAFFIDKRHRTYFTD